MDFYVRFQKHSPINDKQTGREVNLANVNYKCIRDWTKIAWLLIYSHEIIPGITIPFDKKHSSIFVPIKCTD